MVQSKNKYLITGVSGFVGGYLVEFLLSKYSDITIVGISRKSDVLIEDSRFSLVKIDLNDKLKVEKIIRDSRPDIIIHLAAESSVGFSWKYPDLSFRNNVNIFLNVLEAIKNSQVGCRLLSIGSSESYGAVEQRDIPLKESNVLNPISPYAVARVAQEMLAKVYVDGYGLNIVQTRSFNHIGARQDLRFVIPSFVNKILKRKFDNSLLPVETGNLEIIRDFLDVRDVVRAYDLLIEYGDSGEIYNICSGNGYSLFDIFKLISKKVNHFVETKINPSFLRPNDNPVIIGNNSKLMDLCGWAPKYNIEQSIESIIDFQVSRR